jgi:hypothetical protein
MELLFLSLPGKLQSISEGIYSVIGVTDYLEGDSSHVLGGVSYEGMLRGCSICIALNAYEYEDLYNIMITIKCSPEMRNLGIEDEVANHVISLLLRTFRIPIAKEVGISELSVFMPSDES